MRPVTFSSCADELSVALDCLVLGMLATESCRADTDAVCPPLVVVTLRGPYCRQPAPLLTDRGTISR